MRRGTYANVTATTALVLAMAGGAYAANHYLINSTRQISPRVLKQLRGARGPRGEAGALGPIGPQGETGPAGHVGKRGETGERGPSALAPLEAGSTENGDFEVSAPAGDEGTTVHAVVSLPIPLAAAVEEADVEYATTGKGTEHCAGPGSAARGYLCIYVASESNLTPTGVFDPESSTGEGSGRYGFGMTWTLTAMEAGRAYGTYSVTAG